MRGGLRMWLAPVVVVFLVWTSGAAVPAAGAADERAITYVGVTYDRTDLEALGIGRAGYWFPQFNAPVPVSGRPTAERAVDSRPSWVAPLNHAATPTDLGCTPAQIAEGCLPTYLFRSFTRDQATHSKGGQLAWNRLTLPDGRVGRSGAIVDPNSAGNTSNTINRIQLRGDVPTTFYFHVVTDNTHRQHDPTMQIRARGNAGPVDQDGTQVDTEVFPRRCDLRFNGVADVYTFRYDGFTAGDYLKLRLEGDAAPDGAGASFGGLLFDETFEVPRDHHDVPRGGPPPEGC